MRYSTPRAVSSHQAPISASGFFRRDARRVRRARVTGLPKVPVVLTNHPKDIRDWDALERFVTELASAGDIQFITLSELAKGISAGDFQVRHV